MARLVISFKDKSEEEIQLYNDILKEACGDTSAYVKSVFRNLLWDGRSYTYKREIKKSDDNNSAKENSDSEKENKSNNKEVENNEDVKNIEENTVDIVEDKKEDKDDGENETKEDSIKKQKNKKRFNVDLMS